MAANKLAVLIIAVACALALGSIVFLHRHNTCSATVVELEDPRGERVRRIYAHDRGRYETADGFVHVVRLDKGEVWVWDQGTPVCSVYPIEELEKWVLALDLMLTLTARYDEEWQSRRADVRRVLNGDYELERIEAGVEKRGYSCLEVQVELGDVLRVTSFLAYDARLPDTSVRVDEVMALLGGASSGHGTALYFYRQKSRALGNIPVETTASIWLPEPAGRTESRSWVREVKRERVRKSLFEIPKGYTIDRWSFE